MYENLHNWHENEKPGEIIGNGGPAQVIDAWKTSPFIPMEMSRGPDRTQTIRISPVTLFKISKPSDTWVLEHNFGMEVFVEVFSDTQQVKYDHFTDKLKRASDLSGYVRKYETPPPFMVTTVKLLGQTTGYARVTGVVKNADSS